MTPAVDKNGAELKVGDKVTLEATVTGIFVSGDGTEPTRITVETRGDKDIEENNRTWVITDGICTKAAE